MVTRYSESDRSGLIVGGCLVLALLLVLCCAGFAEAQTTPVFNPRYVSFDPSADHSTTVTVGTTTVPVVTRYELRIYAEGATVPVTTSDLGKPTANGTTGRIEVDRQDVFVAIPVGAYVARVAAIGPGGEGVSLPTDPFGRVSAPSAVPKPGLR